MRGILSFLIIACKFVDTGLLKQFHQAFGKGVFIYSLQKYDGIFLKVSIDVLDSLFKSIAKFPYLLMAHNIYLFEKELLGETS